ncbi:MAG: NADPH:quinone oxidoreductase family protein [Bryobacteraceae bacterium]
MQIMKAWQVESWGEPEAMALNNIAVPAPGPGQVRIRNRASGLNFFDILQVQGKYQVKPPFPFTPGAEVAGIVDAVGSSVIGLQPGAAVLAMAMGGGGFAEYSIAPAHATFPIPPGMSFEEAAAMPVVFHTSYFALKERALLQPGEWLLVHAGASGVGTSAIQIGRALGARVIATAGSPEKLAFAKAQGAELAIGYTDPSWVDQVKQATGGHGANVIYDPVGGDIFDLATKCIAPSGRLLVIGFASGRIPSIAANRVLLKNIAIVGALWGGYVQANPAYLGEAQNVLADMFAKGLIHPPAPIAYPFEALPAALRDLANRKILGKAALVI